MNQLRLCYDQKRSKGVPNGAKPMDTRLAEESGETLGNDESGETRLLTAHAVPTKGAVADWTAQQVVCDLERLGHHGRLVIRCDQEAAFKCYVCEETLSRFQNTLQLEIHKGTASLTVH